MNWHIAMWSCPRSCSTAIARAFEQLPRCFLFDEPFYGPYLLTHGLNHPQRQEILADIDRDYQKVIQKITGELPAGFVFSFQKQIAKHLLPEFQGNWLYSLDNFFLIRDLNKIILSYHKIYNKITSDDIGVKVLYDIFKKVKTCTGKVPIVVSSDELFKNPGQNFKILCEHLKLNFSKQMLTWEPGLKNSNLIGKGVPGYRQSWYSQVMNSQGIIPQIDREIECPAELKPLLDRAMPYYQELYNHRIIFPAAK